MPLLLLWWSIINQRVASYYTQSLAVVSIVRVTTCLENLEMSGNLTAVREMSGKKSCHGKVA